MKYTDKQMYNAVNAVISPDLLNRVPPERIEPGCKEMAAAANQEKDRDRSR